MCLSVCQTPERRNWLGNYDLLISYFNLGHMS